MAIVWYVLIHVSLGLMGFEVFRFTNIGAIYCAAASSVVQGYAIYEIHRLAGPQFRATLGGMESDEERTRETRDYWKRLGRLFIFRLSAFTILTLLVAAVARGAQA